MKNDSAHGASPYDIGVLSHGLCNNNAFQGVAKTVRIVIARPAPNDRRCVLLDLSLFGREDIRGLFIHVRDAARGLAQEEPRGRVPQARSAED